MIPLQAIVVLSGVAAFAPLALFFAYVVRIATITRETAALMPFESYERGMG